MLAVINGKGLQPKTRELMLIPQIQILAKHEFPTMENLATDENKAISLSYGLGWGLYWTPYGEAFFKEGHDVGWRNYTVVFDQSKSALLIMTNRANGEGIFKELIETMLKNPYTPIEWEGYTPYEKLPARPPLKVHKQITVDPKLLDRYVGRYGTPRISSSPSAAKAIISPCRKMTNPNRSYSARATSISLPRSMTTPTPSRSIPKAASLP
jgi:hypothetical protein